MIKKIAILILLSIYSNACYHKESTNEFVTISRTDSNLYELHLINSNTGRGNIHTLDMSKYEYDGHLWLYFDSFNGTIGATDIIWTHERGKLYSPWVKNNLKGFIRFDSGKVQINLSYPFYTDGVSIDHWEELEENGEYEIVFNLDSISQVTVKNTEK